MFAGFIMFMVIIASLVMLIIAAATHNWFAFSGWCTMFLYSLFWFVGFCAS